MSTGHRALTCAICTRQPRTKQIFTNPTHDWKRTAKRILEFWFASDGGGNMFLKTSTQTCHVWSGVYVMVGRGIWQDDSSVADRQRQSFGYVHIRSRSVAPTHQCHFLRSSTQTWERGCHTVTRVGTVTTSCWSPETTTRLFAYKWKLSGLIFLFSSEWIKPNIKSTQLLLLWITSETTSPLWLAVSLTPDDY